MDRKVIIEEMEAGRRAAAEQETVTSAQMKEIERRADEAGLSYYQMMENAGTGAAEYIDSQFPVSDKRVLIFCGKGNNGGDGFVAARKFAAKGAKVTLILAEGRPKTQDALKNYELCQAAEIPTIIIAPTEGEGREKGNGPESGNERELNRLAEEAELIIDAIYGTGFHGELREPVRKLLQMINCSGARIFALDIPSGLNGDTGTVDEDTVRAAETIVFHRLKPVHAIEKCGIYCGKTVCISIGIEEVLAG